MRHTRILPCPLTLKETQQGNDNYDYASILNALFAEK